MNLFHFVENGSSHKLENKGYPLDANFYLIRTKMIGWNWIAPVFSFKIAFIVQLIVLLEIRLIVE